MQLSVHPWGQHSGQQWARSTVPQWVLKMGQRWVLPLARHSEPRSELQTVQPWAHESAMPLGPRKAMRLETPTVRQSGHAWVRQTVLQTVLL